MALTWRPDEVAVVGFCGLPVSAAAAMAEQGVTRLLAVNPANARHVVGKIALHDLVKARARHLEDEHRRERILPFEYLLPPWLRPARPVVRDQR